MNNTSPKASYRKYNDRQMNSSTYHKKDGTPIRAIIKEETRLEVIESTENENAQEN